MDRSTRTRPPVRPWHFAFYALMLPAGFVVGWDGLVRDDTLYIFMGAFFMLAGVVLLVLNGVRYREQRAAGDGGQPPRS